MLTKEKLTATPGLESLSAEQMDAIALLSQNDENAVVANFSKNFHDQLDASVYAASGIEKVGDEKSYAYASRALKVLKDRTDGAVSKADFEALKAEHEALKSTASDPEGWKRKAEDAERTVTKLRKDQQAMIANHATELQTARVHFAIDQAVAGLKLNGAVSEELRTLARDSAVARVKGLKAEVDTENGNRIIFRDETGAQMLNPKNFQNPYTVTELLTESLDKYGVLDKGKPAGGGAGSSNPAGKGEGGNGGKEATVTIDTARTKQEAIVAIQKQLGTQGLQQGSREYAIAQQKAYVENKVSELPDAE